jgi:hypothetical protein
MNFGCEKCKIYKRDNVRVIENRLKRKIAKVSIEKEAMIDLSGVAAPLVIKYDKTYKTLFVLDIRNCELIQLDDKGKIITKIGRKGKGPGEFIQPYSFCFSEKNIYVLDQALGRISKFDRSGNFIKSFILDYSPHKIFLLKNKIIISKAPDPSLIMRNKTIFECYSEDFSHIKGFYNFRQVGGKKENNILGNVVQGDIVGDEFYFGFVFPDYKISRIDSNLNIIEEINFSSQVVKSNAFSINKEQSTEYLGKINICDLLVTSNYILASSNCGIKEEENNKIKNYIDIFSRDTGKYIASISSDELGLDYDEAGLRITGYEENYYIMIYLLSPSKSTNIFSFKIML